MYFRKPGTDRIYTNKDMAHFFERDPTENMQDFLKEFEQVAPRAKPKKNQLANDFEEPPVVEWKTTAQWAEIDAEKLRLIEQADAAMKKLQAEEKERAIKVKKANTKTNKKPLK